jgi:hypothetical protein
MNFVVKIPRPVEDDQLQESLFAESFDKPDEDHHIEALEDEFPTMAGAAFGAARARVLASGQSVLQSEQGSICEVFPDGRRRIVKKISPPVQVVCGRIITRR